jgi:hypothetical protein
MRAFAGGSSTPSRDFANARWMASRRLSGRPCDVASPGGRGGACEPTGAGVLTGF